MKKENKTKKRPKKISTKQKSEKLARRDSKNIENIDERIEIIAREIKRQGGQTELKHPAGVASGFNASRQ